MKDDSDLIEQYSRFSSSLATLINRFTLTLGCLTKNLKITYVYASLASGLLNKTLLN